MGLGLGLIVGWLVSGAGGQRRRRGPDSMAA